MSEYNKKIFGVALDPADDPWTLQLKRQWTAADTKGLDWLSACLDPYDAVTGSMAAALEKRGIEPFGKFPIPSWLWPKPGAADLPYITPRNMADFFESDSLVEIAGELKSFVRDNIFPEMPVMVGIDHSATAGVVSALAERYGPEKLTVVVLDQHFDAIPLSVRLKGAAQADPGFMPGTAVGFSDRFCCGNFWAYLMDDGIILPQNLLLIGVADYPQKGEDLQENSFRDAYLEFESRGCKFFPRSRFDSQYLDSLSGFLRDNIHAPNVYVSLDLDVGSYEGTYAARYMERPGIGAQDILEVADIIAKECRSGRFKLAGLDVMEFNMHFLGIETADGIKDNTLTLVKDFITALA